MSHEHAPSPVAKKLLTPGVMVLLLLIAIGLFFAAKRFIFGLESVTNLDQQYPWGIWIAFDVATGVALAAGGFMTAALAHIFHREHYHAVVRPALLTAMLGYTFVGIGLMADLGRYYNIWHPSMPWMWSPNSVLFEVGMCVMCYLTVLYTEFAPIVCERLEMLRERPKLVAFASKLRTVLQKIMPFFLIAGVVLSCLHQSSLGNLIVIAEAKYHALWWTPISPLLFLLSAFAVGYAMVIFESMYAAWSFELKPEMHILAPLSKYVVFFVGLYLAVKIGDLAIREKLSLIGEGTVQSMMWLLEIVGGLIVPLAMLMSAKVRRSPKLLFIAALLIVAGVALNRINVFLVAYQPLFSEKTYFPSIGEFAVTVGLVSLLILIYRILVTYLPVISLPQEARKA